MFAAGVPGVGRHESRVAFNNLSFGHINAVLRDIGPVLSGIELNRHHLTVHRNKL
jgi:hypothetical protein